jgi:hypothetical protein
VCMCVCVLGLGCMNTRALASIDTRRQNWHVTRILGLFCMHNRALLHA